MDNLLPIAITNDLTMPAHLPMQEQLAGYLPDSHSNVFQATTGINPLATAAASLLYLATKLGSIGTILNAHTLHENLVNEIKAFECKAKAEGYASNVIRAACYILSAFIDEMLLNSTWGEQQNWKSKTLVRIFQDDPWGGERFFLILQRCAEDPDLYTDLLELIYLCLSLGFEGKYRYQPRGHIVLSTIRDNLYHGIRQQRGEFNKSLHIKTNLLSQTPPKLRPRTPSLNLLSLTTALLLGAMYLGFSFNLYKISQAVYQSTNQLLNTQKDTGIGT